MGKVGGVGSAKGDRAGRDWSQSGRGYGAVCEQGSASKTHGRERINWHEILMYAMPREGGWSGWGGGSLPEARRGGFIPSFFFKDGERFSHSPEG